MYRRVAVVGRVATSLSRSHPARRTFSTSKSLSEDNENKPRSRRTIRTDLLDTLGTKPTAEPKEPEVSSAPSATQPADASSTTPLPAPEVSASVEPLNNAPDVEPSSTAQSKELSSVPPSETSPASAAPVSGIHAAVVPPKTTIPPPTTTLSLAETVRRAKKPSSTVSAPSPTTTAPSSKSLKAQSFEKTTVPASTSQTSNSTVYPSPLSPSPKTTAFSAPEADPSPPAVAASHEVQDIKTSSRSDDAVVEDHLGLSSDWEDNDNEASALLGYDGEFVDVENIQLPRFQPVPPDPLTEAVARQATKMAHDPKYPLTDIQLGLATDRVKQDVLNAGWPLTTLNLQAALMRKVALKKYKQLRKKPPPFLRHLSGFLAHAVGARRSVRWPDGSYRPPTSVGSTRGKLERAQIRVPTNSARLPAALVAATALPAKPVKLQRQGELDRDMFGFLRMRRNHVQWRQEVAGGDYGRFSAHVPVPETLDPTADDGKAQIAVRSAFLALQRNATVTLKGKREIYDIYRDYVRKDTKLPDQTDSNPTIDFDELVDVLLSKKSIPNRLVGIIRPPPSKSIAAP